MNSKYLRKGVQLVQSKLWLPLAPRKRVRSQHYHFATLLMGGWEVVSSLSFTSEYFSTYIDYLLSAMSWHNGCIHQQVYKFRKTVGSKNDRWDRATAVRSKHGGCASLHDGKIEARLLESLHDRYTDARACASFHQPLYGCKNWCQHNG